MSVELSCKDCGIGVESGAHRCEDCWWILCDTFADDFMETHSDLMDDLSAMEELEKKNE